MQPQRQRGYIRDGLQQHRERVPAIGCVVGRGYAGDAVVHARAVEGIGVRPDAEPEAQATPHRLPRDEPQGFEVAVPLVVRQPDRGHVVARHVQQKRVGEVEIDVADLLRVVVLDAEGQAERVEAVACQHGEVGAPEIAVVQPAAVFDLVGDEAGDGPDAVGGLFGHGGAELQPTPCADGGAHAVGEFGGGVDQAEGVAASDQEHRAPLNGGGRQQNRLRPVRHSDSRWGSAAAGKKDDGPGCGSDGGCLPHVEAACRQSGAKVGDGPAPWFAAGDRVRRIGHERDGVVLRQRRKRKHGERSRDGTAQKSAAFDRHILCSRYPRLVRGYFRGSLPPPWSSVTN